MLHAMHIELGRVFRELLQKEPGDKGESLYQGNVTLTLQELLNERRVVVLSEAGSGKTQEIREAARRLRAAGKPAFFLRLEHVAIDFDSAFEEGTLEEFECWLTSPEPGWLLLDSIDESRLRSPIDFEAAMRKVSRRLATAKQRTHLLVTGRTPAWRPKTDHELCAGLFPVVADPSSATPLPFKIVTLQDLSTEQVRRFADAKGIHDIPGFLDAIERADAWSFTARPQDLDELTGFWIDNGRIGSRLELMTNSIRRRLKEPSQSRAEAHPLSEDRALDGARTVAAALALTQLQTIQVPDGVRRSQGLRLDDVLKGWTASEVGTLLQRPLFAQDVYGTVRFHHRSVKEYLAAQWFVKLLDQERSRRIVLELFFREQYGLELVVPSLRPLLPWLAMSDARVLAKVRRIAPEIVFEGGDPVQLPADVRSSILEQVCNQLASGASTRSMADFAAIQRFAALDITETVRRLVAKFRANDDIVSFLMRMVWQGRLVGALPEAMDLARSTDAGHAARIAAFRAVAEVGSQRDMAAIRDEFARAAVGDLNRRCLADLVSHIALPDADSLQWLLHCIPRLAEFNKFETSGLSEETASFFERADITLVADAIDRLRNLLMMPPVIERRYCEISKQYQWLRRAAAVSVRRLIEARRDAALSPAALDVLQLLPQDGYARDFDLDKGGLAQLVCGWSDLKWRLFWHVIGKERAIRARKGESVIDSWMATFPPTYVTFDAADFGDALKAIEECPLADDRMVALSLAYRLYVQGGRVRSSNAALKKAVAGDERLSARLALLLKPPKQSDEIRKMKRENSRWSRIAAARGAREAKHRLEAPARLEAQLDTLRDPGFDDPTAMSRAQYYLFERMRELDEKNSSRWTSANWRGLEAEFGAKVSQAFRDALVAYWRRHAPVLVSEGAAINTTPGEDLFGLAGLTIEAAEVPDLFTKLQSPEASVAFRYAMRELNGFPVWFPALSKAHLDVVRQMALTEIRFELGADRDDVQRQYIIADLSREGDWLWDSVAPDIVALLRDSTPRSSEVLCHLLDIVQKSRVPDGVIAALAAEKVRSRAETRHLPVWAATWTGVEPGPAIDAVDLHLAALADGKSKTQFAMSYVAHLLGGRRMPSRARAGFHSPATLRRLYLLVHTHVRSSDDVDRSNKGVYSPGLRDDAQDARERLAGILGGIPGRDAYLALRMIAEDHPEPELRPWFALRARAKAEADSERPAWSGEQVSQFGLEFERTPSNHRELFDLAVLRLLDLKAELEDGDASAASVVIKAERETEVRNYIASWCSRCSLGRYVIPQEEELADAKRPDLRWHGLPFNGPVPTELKIADNWTGPQLFERLEAQLAGDYLRDISSSRGIYLLVWRGVRKHWQLPGGELATFDELVSALQGHWEQVASAHPGVEEVRVIGIDLTKRARAPLLRMKPAAVGSPSPIEVVVRGSPAGPGSKGAVTGETKSTSARPRRGASGGGKAAR
jgi:hypothetical protein